jgi:hypothetical protein
MDKDPLLPKDSNENPEETTPGNVDNFYQRQVDRVQAVVGEELTRAQISIMVAICAGGLAI